MPIKSVTSNPVARLAKAVDAEVQEVQAKAQGEIFNGWVGKAVSRPSGVGAAAASALGLSAFKPAPPAPTLKRPLVMITGLTMQAASYDPLAKHLASNPKNGAVAVYVVADGKFHQGSVAGPVLSDAEAKKARLFEVQYPEVRAAPTEKAPELAQAFAAIAKVTGAPTVDVVAHSAGCTDFRLYLDSRDPKATVGINQTVLIGPASHGTFMGNVGGAVGGVAGVQAAGQELAVGAPLVSQLNQTWDRQRAQVRGDVTIIGVSGAPTPGPGGVSDGDGFMPVNQLAMPNANTVVLKGADPTPVAHLMEVAYSGVIAEVQKKLG